DFGLAGDLLEFLVEGFMAAGPVDVAVGLREEEGQERPEVAVQGLLPRAVILAHRRPPGAGERLPHPPLRRKGFIGATCGSEIQRWAREVRVMVRSIRRAAKPGGCAGPGEAVLAADRP